MSIGDSSVSSVSSQGIRSFKATVAKDLRPLSCQAENWEVAKLQFQEQMHPGEVIITMSDLSYPDGHEEG